MRQKLIAFLIVMIVALPAFAASDAVPLNSLIQEALKNNPRLKAAHYRAEAAQARAALFRNIPDPMLEYDYDRIIPAEAMSGGGKVRPMRSLSVSQEIPFPTKIFMRKKSAQKEANALQQEYKETEQAVIKEVKEAYSHLYLNRRKVEYLKDSLSLMSQFVEVTNKKYAVNKAGQQDVLRAQVEYSKLSNTVILYEKEARIAQSLLISLLGREDDASIDILPVDPAKDLNLKEEDIVALAKKDRPELKSVREMLEKAEVDSSLSKQEFLPDITVKYQREGKDGKLSRMDEGEWSGSVGINVPLWFWGKQLSGVREARANLEAAKADYKSAENTAVFEAKSAFAKYEAARSLVEIYETGVLPQATSAATTARKAYESGTLGFLELLDSLRMLKDLQMEYFESVSELQVSLADLERSAGGSLGN
ncbi:MAG: TolC family protein [Candidatus Omnitrophica bacterium]|nr:TolC family protein [Candidatus Omnitrophota bacterium]